MAQLELSVVLNLANFRTQLGKLAQASAAYYYPINLTIDKQAFRKQLVALGNIKPVIKIDDSQLDAARARIGTLNKSLATLRRATSTAIEIKVKYKEEGRPAAGTGAVGRAITGRAAGEEALANKNRVELQKLYGLFREANLRVGQLSKGLGKSSAEEIRQSLVPAFSDSGEEAVNGLALGLKDSSSKVAKAAARLAKETIQDTKKAFGIASPSRVFKEIGKDIVDGLELGLQDFNALRTKMVGEMRQLVSAIKREAKVGGITMGGLLSPIARPAGASTRTLPGVVSPTRRGESADPGRGNQKILNSLSLLTGNPALYRGRMANLGAERLPSSLLGAAQSQFQLEELAPSFKQARLASGVSPVDKIIDEAFFGRGTLPRAQSALSTLSNSLERLGSTARATLPSGILQSASGNARMRRFGGVAPGESMGIFEPTARPTAYPPSGGFLEFSRRATAISAGLPGNVFGGRGGGGVPPSGGGGGGFPSDGGLGGRQGPATFIGAGSQMEKFKTVLDVAAASTQRFRASQIPLIGGIKNLAGEFGEATKQVLLYGTAYKGLAFLTSLPGQILNAAKSQQQFNNGLKVATQDTGTFAKELLYVDNVQRAFGLNLETTRTGFTRLYASMAPTGFDSGSIEKLFTGISAATAALQLTPDKAERVIYAFGQMASKGQIMSEELKGQLGDVLPGALAIFSKAAGMSVKEFSKAMEDGEFVGNRFREVFAKVSDELMNRFGTGAAAAGKSLQGLLNTVGGDFQRTLESFAPLANAAAQAVLGPLSGALREISAAAQIAMGEQDRVRKQLEAAQSDVSTLKTGGADAKDIKAAEQNVAALTARYEALNEAAKDPAIAQQVKNIEAFVTEIQKAATFTMNLTGVIGSVLNPFLSILGGNLTSVAGNLTLLILAFNAMKLAALLSTGILATMNAVVAAGGSISTIAAAKNTILAGAFRLLGIQITGAQVATITFGAALKGLLISTGIGALVVLLGSLAASALSVGDAFSTAAAKTKQSMDEMKDAVKTGNVALAKSQLSTATQSRNAIEEQVKYLDEMKKLDTGKGRPVVQTSLARRLMLEQAGFDLKGKTELDLNDLLKQVSKLRADALNLEQRGRVSVQLAAKQEKITGTNQPDPAATQAEDTLQDTKKTNLESYESLRDQLAKNFTQAEIDRREAEHQHKIDLIKSEYDLKEARANSFQKEALRFERRMAEITLERQGALLKASNAVMAAQGSVAGGAGGGLSTTGATGLLQGSTGVSSGAHFDIRRTDGTYISPDQARALLDPAVRRQVTMTSAYGPRRAPVPGASTFHKGVDLAGPANTPLNLAPGYSMVGQGEEGGLGYAATVRGPQGEMYKVGHLQRPAAGTGAGAARKVPGSEKRDIVADQKTQLEQLKQSITVRQAEAKAIEDAKVALADFVATATPIEEQKLQNDLLKRRTELMMQGYSDSAVDQALKFAEAEYKVNFALKLNEELEKKGARTKADAAAIAKQMTEGLTAYNLALEENTKRLRDNRLVQAMTTLKDRMSMAGAMTPDQELREQIRQRDPDFSPAEQESLFQQEKLVQNAEKLKADMQGIAGAIGDSFGNAFKGVITGSMTAQEALAGFFQSVADSFADMVAKMIAEYLKMALIKGIMALIPGLGAVAGGLGGGGQNLGPNSSAVFGLNTPDMSQYSPLGELGVTGFANGGVVTGPTLGLVGEGRYNEAVIPLPDGKSVPVQLSGGDGGNQINSNITVNVSNGQAQSNATGSNSSELGRKIEGAVKQVIVGELRPGGLLASR